LEAELAANQQAQSQLRQELEETQKQLQTQKETYLAEQSKLEAQARALQTAHEEVEQRSRP
jgi:peptidoglycan hydrolase CwlO-like protein